MAGYRARLLVAISASFSIVLFGGIAFIATPNASASGPKFRPARFQVPPAVADTYPLSHGTGLLAACSMGSILLVAGIVAAKRGTITRYVNAPKKVQLEQIPRPEKLLESPRFPLYQGGTDGYFSRATRERHAMTWTAKEEKYFEMPTGGFAYMNKGENLVYFRKKEQAICLCKNLRKLKISDIKIYRIKKDGTVIFMHPLDGIWPENVTTGRPIINWRPFNIGSSPMMASVKWTKYHAMPYEADALSTMFFQARLGAFVDQENVFPLPNVSGWMERDSPEVAEYDKKLAEIVAALPPLPKSL